MNPILIFAGTTEGRRLAEILDGAGIAVTVCVATEYGKQVMPKLSGVTLHQGRLNEEEMQKLMQEGGFLAVVDATHPFAVEVSENIRNSAEALGLPCLRLRRDTGCAWEAGPGQMSEQGYFNRHEDCAAALAQTEGNILLTTGSKDLAVYCREEDMRRRIYARVLPNEESMELCRKAGLLGSQILAMQGPFSTELNIAMLRQYNIRYLVTKESGAVGGFTEKAEAAEQTKTVLCVIGNPERPEGLSFREVCAELAKRTGVVLDARRPLSISLIGAGMGSRSTLTAEAEEIIRKADYVFGAERLLSDMEAWKIKKSGCKGYPCYMAEDIIPILEEIYSVQEEQLQNPPAEIAVLFSGDSGFYSGCQSLYRRLMQWKESGRQAVVRICPGISSVSCFAAACGISWQDAELISIHGKGSREKWEAELLNAVRYHRKVFVLVSGAKDVREAGSVLREAEIPDLKILLGYQLSYPEETIRELTPEACEETEAEGLYIMAVLRESCEKRLSVPQKSDDEFIRGRIPMTKEEVREIVLSKLRLTEDAVVYDIGSGTGSVAVEIAECSGRIQVYALEQKEEGAELIRQNRDKFKLPNIKVLCGTAPEALEQLPEPSHAFIGGSGGRLREILAALYQKNPAMRVVMTAVSLETAAQITEVLKSMPIKEEELIQLQVSRVGKKGAYHLMQAENPVIICSFVFSDAAEA